MLNLSWQYVEVFKGDEIYPKNVSVKSTLFTSIKRVVGIFTVG